MTIIDPTLNLVARRWRSHALGYGWPLQFSRASVANYRDAAALLRQAASGALRHDCLPASGDYLGALIEGQATNLALRNAEFDNAGWTKSNATISANADTAPDGTSSADKLVEASDTGQAHGLVQTIAYTAVAHSASVYVKAAGRSYIMLQLDSTTGSNAFFDIVNGAVGYAGGALTGTAISDAGNGWWRCEIFGTPAAASRNVRITTATGLTNGSESYNGDGSSGVLLWGAQVTTDRYASSVIATAGSQQTRLADVLTLPLSALAASSASEGTLLVEARPGRDLISRALLALSDGGSSNYISLGINAGGGYNAAVTVAGVAQADMSNTSAVALTQVRAAIAWRASDFAACWNGGAVATDSSGSIPSGLTTLHLGSLPGVLDALNGHLLRVAYWPRRLSNTDLQTLTL